MILQDDIRALKMIARNEAEAQSNATRAATITVVVEMLHLMHGKDMVSDADISAFTDKLEAAAAAMMGTTPQVAEALAETTILLRHALGGNAPVNH